MSCMNAAAIIESGMSAVRCDDEPRRRGQLRHGACGRRQLSAAALATLAVVCCSAAASNISPGIDMVDFPAMGSTAVTFELSPSGGFLYVSTNEELLLRLRADDMSVNASLQLPTFGCDTFKFAFSVVSETLIRMWCTGVVPNVFLGVEERMVRAIGINTDWAGLRSSIQWTNHHNITAFNLNLGPAIIREVARDGAREIAYLMYVEAKNPCVSGIFALPDGPRPSSIFANEAVVDVSGLRTGTAAMLGQGAFDHFQLQRGSDSGVAGLQTCVDANGVASAPLAAPYQPYGTAMVLDPVRRRLYVGGQQKLLMLQTDPLTLLSVLSGGTVSDYRYYMVRFDQVALSLDSGILWTAFQEYYGDATAYALNASNVELAYAYFTARDTLGSYRPLAMAHSAEAGLLIFGDTTDLAVVDLLQTDARAGARRGVAIKRLPLDFSAISSDSRWPLIGTVKMRLSPDGAIAYILYNAKPRVIYAVSTSTGAVLATSRPPVGSAQPFTETTVALAEISPTGKDVRYQLSSVSKTISYHPRTGRLMVVTNGLLPSLLIADASGDKLSLPLPPALLDTGVSYSGTAAVLWDPAGSDSPPGTHAFVGGLGKDFLFNVSPLLANQTGVSARLQVLVPTFTQPVSASWAKLDRLLPDSGPGPNATLGLLVLVSFPQDTSQGVTAGMQPPQLVRLNETGNYFDSTSLPVSTAGCSWAATALEPRHGTLYAVMASVWVDDIILLSLDARAPAWNVGSSIRVSTIERSFATLVTLSAALDAGNLQLEGPRLLIGLLFTYGKAALLVVNASAIGVVPTIPVSDAAAVIGKEASALNERAAIRPANATLLVLFIPQVPFVAFGLDDAACTFLPYGVHPQGFAFDSVFDHVYVVIEARLRESACLLKLHRSTLAIIGSARLPVSGTQDSFGLVHDGLDEARRHLVLVAGTTVVSAMRVAIDPLQPVLRSVDILADVGGGVESGGILAAGKDASIPAGMAGVLAPAAGWACPPAAPSANASCLFAGGGLRIAGHFFGLVPSIAELTITLRRVTGGLCAALFSGSAQGSGAGAAWGCAANAASSLASLPLPSLRRLRPLRTILNSSAFGQDRVTGSVVPPAELVREALATATAADVMWELASSESCPNEPPATIGCIPVAGRTALGGANGTLSTLSTITCVLTWPGAASPDRCLRSTLYQVHVSLRGKLLPLRPVPNSTCETPVLVAVTDGGPIVTSVEPGIITAHGQTLTLEVVSPTVLNVSQSIVALLPEAQARAAAVTIRNSVVAGQSAQAAASSTLARTSRCTVSAFRASSAGRMTLSCTAPALRSELVNTPLTVVFVGVGTASVTERITTAAATFASLNESSVGVGGTCEARSARNVSCAASLQPLVALLPLAALYPLPVLSAVTPSSAVSAGMSLSVVSDALALPSADQLVAPPQLRVWVGSVDCAAPQYVTGNSRTVECTAPPGGGRAVPVVVEVTHAASGAAFNVSSRAFAATPPSQWAVFAAASAYSGQTGQLLDAAAAPAVLTGIGSDRVTYRSPDLQVVQREPVQLLAADCAQKNSTAGTALSSGRVVAVNVSVSELPPSQQARILIATIPCAGVLQPVCAANGYCSVSCLLNASLLCLATSDSAVVATRPLRGAVKLPVSLLSLPPTPRDGVELSLAVAQAERTIHAQLLDAVSVHGAPVLQTLSPSRGAAGTLIEATGLALGLSAADIVAIYVGGSRAQNVTWRTSTTVLFAAPPLNAALSGSATASVQIVTVGGSSAEQMTFQYPEVFALAWGDAAAQAATALASAAQEWRLSAANTTAAANLQQAMDAANSTQCIPAVVALPSTAAQRNLLQPEITIEAAFGRPLTCSLGLLPLSRVLRWDGISMDSTFSGSLAASAQPELASSLQISRAGTPGSTGSLLCTITLADAADLRPVQLSSATADGRPLLLYRASFGSATLTVHCDGMPPGALPPSRLAFAITGACEDSAGALSALLQPFLIVISGAQAVWTPDTVAAVTSAPLLPLAADDRNLRAVLTIDPWPAGALRSIGSMRAASSESSGISSALSSNSFGGAAFSEPDSDPEFASSLAAFSAILSCTATLRVAQPTLAGTSSAADAGSQVYKASTQPAVMRRLGLPAYAGPLAPGVAGSEILPGSPSMQSACTSMAWADANTSLVRVCVTLRMPQFTLAFSPGEDGCPVHIGVNFPWFAFLDAATAAFAREVSAGALVASTLAMKASQPLLASRQLATLLPAEVAASCSWTGGVAAVNITWPSAALSNNNAVSQGSVTSMITGANGSLTSRLPAQVVVPHMLWAVHPPSEIDSQSLISPAPSAALLLPASLPASVAQLAANATSCTLSARVTLPAAVQQRLANAPLTTAARSASKLASSLVVPQTINGAEPGVALRVTAPDAPSALELPRPAPACTFDSVLIAGYRESLVSFEGRCQFGSVDMLPLAAAATIAGCPVGSAPAGETGWLCAVCGSGQWSRGGAMSCTGCPAAGVSCVAGVLTLRPGFYVNGARLAARSTGDAVNSIRMLQAEAASSAPLDDSSILAAVASGDAAAARSPGGVVLIDASLQLRACINPAACTLNTSALRSTGIVEYGCAPGYGGSLCGTCDTAVGYTLTDSIAAVCARCGSPAASVLLIVVLVLPALGAIAWLSLRNPTRPALSTATAAANNNASETSATESSVGIQALGGSRMGARDATASTSLPDPSGGKSEPTTSFKMVATHLQTLNALTLLRSGSANILRRLLSWSAVAAADPSAFPSLACAVPVSYAARFVALLLLPIVLLAAAALARVAINAAKGSACTARVGCRFRLCGCFSCGRLSQLRSRVWRSAPRPMAAPSASASVTIADTTLVTVSPLAVGTGSNVSRRVQASAANSPCGSASISSDRGAAGERAPVLWWLISCAVLLATLAYMPLVQASIAALDCLPEPVDGARLLRADLSVRCGSSSHAPIAALAISVLVLVGLGLPALIGVIVLAVVRPAPTTQSPAATMRIGSAADSTTSVAVAQKQRSCCRRRKVSLQAGVSQPIRAIVSAGCFTRSQAWLRGVLPPEHVFASLYGDYAVERNRGWFEAAVLARKTGLAMAMQLLSTAGEQALVASVVLLFALLCSMWARPYRRDRSNTLELAQLAALSLSAVLSLTYALPGAGSPDAEPREAAAAAFILLVNVAALALVVYDACSASRRYIAPAAGRLVVIRRKLGSLVSVARRTARPLTSGAAPLPAELPIASTAMTAANPLAPSSPAVLQRRTILLPSDVAAPSLSYRRLVAQGGLRATAHARAAFAAAPVDAPSASRRRQRDAAEPLPLHLPPPAGSACRVVATPRAVRIIRPILAPK